VIIHEGPPPLTPAEARLVLQQLGDLTQSIVLVGGQAVAFWADRYRDRCVLPGPVNSKDIDFCGLQDSVAIAAARLQGTFQVPEPFSNTPNTGLVVFHDSGGNRRLMDFLGDPFGLDYADVIEWAVDVDVAVAGEVVTFKVMHPVHSLESRISNVGGLPGYQTRLALDQARAAVLCAREYLRDRLDVGDERAARAVLRLNERIYRFAWQNPHAQKVVREQGIDPFDAILVDDRLPQRFRERRYPDMRRNLERKRAKTA
jgi:hypothetical protein